MIFPCIDIMDGKTVQLVQGREKALQADAPEEMLRKFAAFPEIQVIDLDAAMGRGSNDDLVRLLASKAAIRAGGGVRTVERARALVDQGARKVIVGTAAFGESGINRLFLEALCDSIGRDRVIIALDSKYGHIVVKGWREATRLTAQEVLGPLGPYCSGFLCTYVDKEGMMQGTDLAWFARLRAATSLELTAAGGVTTMEDVRALLAIDVHVAIGMAMYTGRLKLEDLSAADNPGWSRLSGGSSAEQ
jgi:phosphoribosylformimino-5-aminoimidazole carboxamide ribotide isomerase